MEELNVLLLEIEQLNKKIYEIDVFIRFYLKQLQDKFPKIWERFIDLKTKYLNRNNLIEEEALDNPLIKDDSKEDNALKKFKKKKIKELYRRISNLTHPDKVVNSYLNELFIIAKKHKDTQNLRALENIYDIIQKQDQRDEYEFFAVKLVELKEKLNQLNNLHSEQLVSFEYRVSSLYESPDEQSKKMAEDIFISKLTELSNFYQKEITK